MEEGELALLYDFCDVSSSVSPRSGSLQVDIRELYLDMITNIVDILYINNLILYMDQYIVHISKLYLDIRINICIVDIR